MRLDASRPVANRPAWLNSQRDWLCADHLVERLTETDRRGMSALFWTHLNLHSRFELELRNFIYLAAEGHEGT
jgi:hypothetical protein